MVLPHEPRRRKDAVLAFAFTFVTLLLLLLLLLLFLLLLLLLLILINDMLIKTNGPESNFK